MQETIAKGRKSYKPKRPNYTNRLTDEQINKKIKREKALTKHYLWMFCVRNSIWIIPVISLIAIAIVVDLCIIFLFWKNPTILFVQLKIFIGWIISYILGLYTDEIRSRITKR